MTCCRERTVIMVAKCEIGGCWTQTRGFLEQTPSLSDDGPMCEPLAGTK